MTGNESAWMPPSAEGMTSVEQLRGDLSRITAAAAMAFESGNAEVHETAITTINDLGRFMVEYIKILQARLSVLGGDISLPPGIG